MVKNNKYQERIKPEYSPQTTYFAFDEYNNIIGGCNIRHELKGNLINHGGNIGYLVRPSKRNLGYGSRILEEALKNGNKNSITSIMDANITTLIAAIILFALGESSVKGFATMLIISIVVTIVVMVYVVRWLLGMFVKCGCFNNRYQAFLGIKNLEKRSILERFDYVKHLNKFVIATVIILIAGGVYFFKNGFNLGIDFAGGSSISLTSADKLNIKEVEKDIESLGYKIAKSESIDENTVYLTVKEVFDASDNDKVTEYFDEKYEGSTTSIGSVSNIVKKQLLENAIKSLIFACIGLIIYVTLILIKCQ